MKTNLLFIALLIFTVITVGLVGCDSKNTVDYKSGYAVGYREGYDKAEENTALKPQTELQIQQQLIDRLIDGIKSADVNLQIDAEGNQSGTITIHYER